MKQNYTPPYLTILISIGLLNIFLSAHFITLLLVGVVFKIFLEALRKEHYYLLVFVILTFLIIETTQGFKVFSLSVISLIIYYFILPRIRHLFSASLLAEFMYITSFYVLLFGFLYFTSSFTSEIVLVLIFNFLLDSFIVGFIL